MPTYIMALDQGTTSSRACLISQDGRLVGQASEPFPQIYPRPGWVEHDPDAIWSSTTKCIREVLRKTNVSARDIAAIGVTNQRETVVAWDSRDGRPLMNAIVWQCRRTQDLCARWKKSGHEARVRKKTGLVLDPYFSGSKMHWILKNVPGAKALDRDGHLRLGTIDTFLIWRLTSGRAFVTDVSNASRTLLMNIHRGAWDPDLCRWLGLSIGSLPQIRSSSGDLGATAGLGELLPDGVPIRGVAGDQQAALFGQTAFAAGESKCTFGTGSFLLMNTGTKPVPSKHGLLTTVAWRVGEEKTVYALEGGAFICGAAVQWLRDGLGLIEQSSDVESLAASVEDTMGVEFVPALTGLGAPHWRPDARGVITGLTRGVTKAHLARATLEAMALQNVEIMLAMQKDLGKKIRSVRVDGGAAANNLLMQMQADYLGAEVVRPEIVETTAMGAAYLAGLGVGLWSDLDEIRKIWRRDREFEPCMTSRERQRRLLRWQDAVEKA